MCGDGISDWPHSKSAWVGTTEGCELPVSASLSPRAQDSKPCPGHQAISSPVMEELKGFHKHLAQDTWAGREKEGGKQDIHWGVYLGRVRGLGLVGKVLPRLGI